MWRLVPLVLLAVLAAGCSSPDTAPPSAAPSVPLEQADPTPTPTPTSPAELGSAQVSTATASVIKVSVLRVRQPLRAVVPGLPERAGYEYIGLEARACLIESTEPEPLTVSWRPWSLTFADDTVAEALSSWSDEWWSVPLYPQDRVLRPGQCLKGWIPFTAPKGSKPTVVTYQPGAGNALEWRVK